MDDSAICSAVKVFWFGSTFSGFGACLLSPVAVVVWPLSEGNVSRGCAEGRGRQADQKREEDR